MPSKAKSGWMDWILLRNLVHHAVLTKALFSIYFITSHSHRIEGLSAGEVLNGKPVVFATSLDARGPAVFSISKHGHTLIATGEQIWLKLKMVGVGMIKHRKNCETALVIVSIKENVFFVR